MAEEYQELFNLMGIDSSAGMATFFALMLWSLIWKGIALWKASQNSNKPWFIALLVLNTMGLLEIIYVFFFSKKKKDVEMIQK